jgi:hypothetical protein
MRQLGRLGRERRIKLEVARVKQRAVTELGQQHRRAKAVAGRKGSQPQATKLERLAIPHLEHAMLRPHAMSVQASRPGCRQCQFVPRDVIAMRVRNKAPRLATTYIDRQLGRRQKQSRVVVKQNASRLTQTTVARTLPIILFALRAPARSLYYHINPPAVWTYLHAHRS